MIAENEVTIPSEEELVNRATAMVSWLRERALETEKAQQVSAETIEMFRQAGFFKILQPKMWGGYEKSPIVFYRVLQELASGCPSSGWVAMVLGIHNWEMALFHPEIAKRVWGDNNQILTSSSYAPFGKAVKTEGGYLVSGTWLFSSGCDHAQWALLGALVDIGQPEPEYRVFLVPCSQYKIDGSSWDVHGLRGTGSKSLIVNECFIEEAQSHSMNKHFMELGSDEGLKHYDNPYYRLSFGVTFFNGVASVMAGMAKGMVQIYREQMQARRDNVTGLPLSINPMVQRRVQIADSKARQASNLIRSVVEAYEPYIFSNTQLPMDRRAQWVADGASVGELCSDVSILLFRGAGAKAVYSSNLLGLFMRDIQCGCNHICMDYDRQSVNAGGTLLGLDNMYPIT